MLYRLEIENFYSILDKQVVDLRVAANVRDEERLGAPYPGSSERVPKVVAIFGPNASGKTTVLRALAFLAWFVSDSFQLQPEASLPLARFGHTDNVGKPTRLAVSLGGATSLVDGDATRSGYGTYYYELHISHRLSQPSVVQLEALSHRPHGTRRPYRVFRRDEKGGVVAGNDFPVSKYGAVVEKIRSNASVISTLAQFDHSAAVAVRRAAQTVLTNLFVVSRTLADSQVGPLYDSNPVLLDALNREISRIDVGTRQVRVQKGPQGVWLEFDHEGLSFPIPWSLESNGTQSFVRSFPWISQALIVGGIAVIDEMDASLHPLMLPEIARWFYDHRRNPHNAQLWMTCQNASFMEELMKEEVLFCEKDSSGRTRVYGLRDVRNVRRVDNFYRKYLSGAYGAVPNIG